MDGITIAQATDSGRHHVEHVTTTTAGSAQTTDTPASGAHHPHDPVLRDTGSSSPQSSADRTAGSARRESGHAIASRRALTIGPDMVERDGLTSSAARIVRRSMTGTGNDPDPACNHPASECARCSEKPATAVAGRSKAVPGVRHQPHATNERTMQAARRRSDPRPVIRSPDASLTTATISALIGHAETA